MSDGGGKFTALTTDLHDYIVENGSREDPTLTGVRERTAELERENGEPFDLAFIDADKTGYPDYYEACLRLLRPGGLIVIDNVLMGGRVLDPPEEDESARTIAELNEAIIVDNRVDVAMLDVADGITLALKR